MSEERSPSTGLLIGLVVAVLVVHLAYGIIVYRSVDSWNDRGTFGDMFGGVNSLFSGLAFAGVIYAIFLQQYELRLQRKELRLQREAMQLMKEGQDRTAEAQEQGVELLEEERKERDAAVMPSFTLMGIQFVRSTPTERIMESGLLVRVNEVRDLEAIVDEPANISLHTERSRYVPKDGEVGFVLRFPPELTQIPMDLNFTDVQGARRRQRFTININAKQLVPEGEPERI